MTTPQFIEWLTVKVTKYFRSRRLSQKVIPPAKVLGERLEEEVRAALERRIVDELIKSANIPARVEANFAKVKSRVYITAKKLARGLPSMLKDTPAAHWTTIVTTEASGVAGEKLVNNAKSEA